MDNYVSLKNTTEDGFEIVFDVLPVVEITDERKVEVLEGINSIDEQLEYLQNKIDSLNQDIDKLTCHADGADYAIAVTCGIITGIFDSLVVGKWDFKEAKAKSNKEINEKVLNFAKKDPDYKKYLENKKSNNDPDRLKNAIEFLEKKYKLPGDGGYKDFKHLGINDKTHHLDDFCHHPTLVGLVCCILVQFTGSATYRSSNGNVVKNIPIEVNNYGKFVSEETWGKFFAGVINWFFNVAQTMKNRKGHLMSDMAGSSSSAGKGNEGAGLPGSFLSTAKEIASLPCFQDTNFAENLRKAYQNGIGTGKKQVDLGPFNSLFQGASSKLDMRTELAVKKELQRQSVPVIMNELLVRGLYFVRRFVMQMKEKNSLTDIDWKEVLPVCNRTIVRMMTIASGTFTAIDMADAAIRSAIDSKGVSNPAFLSNMILRVNFVGVGRFTVAVATDVGMGVKKSIKRNERMKLYNEQIALLDAKVYYKQANMWIEAEEVEKTLDEAYEVLERSTAYYCESMSEISKDVAEIKTYIPEVREKNPGLIEEMLDILEWGE